MSPHLEGARCHIAILGEGAAYALTDAETQSFIEATGIPLLPMSMAKGPIPADYP